MSRMKSANLLDFHTFWFRFSEFRKKIFSLSDNRDNALAILNIWENYPSYKNDSYKNDSYKKDVCSRIIKWKLVAKSSWKMSVNDSLRFLYRKMCAALVEPTHNHTKTNHQTSKERVDLTQSMTHTHTHTHTQTYTELSA